MKNNRIFQLETIHDSRGIARGGFVSADTANITKLTLTPTQDKTAFVISEEITPISVPLYIRGTYDAEANTFTPDVDYTVQEISAAVSAGRYVALVVGGEYIVPCVECNSLYCIFSLLQISDILNITDDYINIRISRRSGGWNVERTGLVLQENGFVDRREEWLAWLLESEGQTSDADVSLSQVFRFLKQLPDGLHYLDNTACWGKFWSVNQGGKCVVFAPPDIYIITGDSGVLKMTSAGTLEKYSNSGEMLVKSVDLLNSVPPKTTSADAGKVLTVAADGSLVWQ